MIDEGKVEEKFTYTEAEQKTFPYLRDYMEGIRKHLPEILQDEEKRVRFALAGLFLSYRAMNHQGGAFSTSPLGFDEASIHAHRLRMYLEMGGSPFVSTQEYLDLIGLKPVRISMQGFAQSIGEFLCSFVLRGKR
jgi:hypothetical protein